MSDKQLEQDLIDCGWNCVIAKSGDNTYITVNRIVLDWSASFPKAIITIDNHYRDSRYQRKKRRGAVENKHTFLFKGKPSFWSVVRSFLGLKK